MPSHVKKNECTPLLHSLFLPPLGLYLMLITTIVVGFQLNGVLSMENKGDELFFLLGSWTRYWMSKKKVLSLFSPLFMIGRKTTSKMMKEVEAIDVRQLTFIA